MLHNTHCIWEVFQEESEQYVLPLALFCMIRSGTRLLWCYSSLWWGSINVSTQSYLLSLKSIDPQDLTAQCKKEEQDFFDVTLARDDEQFYSHKVIRWAWSPFFCKILLHNVEEEPCLFEANLYDWKPPSVGRQGGCSRPCAWHPLQVRHGVTGRSSLVLEIWWHM